MLSLSQSGVIAGWVPCWAPRPGWGTATAVLFALNQVYAARWPAPSPYPIAVPWQMLGIVAVLVPAVAMLGAGLLTRSRLPIERRLDDACAAARAPAGRPRRQDGGMALASLARRLGHRPWFARLGRFLVPADRLVGRLTKGRVVALGLLPRCCSPTPAGAPAGRGRPRSRT